MKNALLIVSSMLLTVFICVLVLPMFPKDSKYTCEDGYELSNDKCRRIKDFVDASYDEYCEDESEVVDNKCLKEVKADKSDVLVCDSGYTLIDDKCTKEVSVNANVKYSCVSGYKLSGSKCSKEVADEKLLEYGQYCPGGGKVVHVGTNTSLTRCQITKKAGAKCPDGYIDYSSTICWLGTIYNSNGEERKSYRQALNGYYCSSGRMEGGPYNPNSKCYVTKTVNATASYSCNAGYTLKSNKCYKAEKINPKKVFGCPSDYKEEDEKCTKIDKIEPKKKYKCDEGYTLFLDKCVVYEYKDPIKKEN